MGVGGHNTGRDDAGKLLLLQSLLHPWTHHMLPYGECSSGRRESWTLPLAAESCPFPILALGQPKKSQLAATAQDAVLS